MVRFKLIEWVGFEIIEQEYYESCFGVYDKTGKKRQNNLRDLNYEGKFIEFLKKFFIILMPNLKDNHLFVCKKNIVMSSQKKNPHD